MFNYYRKSSRIGIIKPSAVVSPQQHTPPNPQQLPPQHYNPFLPLPTKSIQPFMPIENPFNLTMMSATLNLNTSQKALPQPPQVQQQYHQIHQLQSQTVLKQQQQLQQAPQQFQHKPQASIPAPQPIVSQNNTVATINSGINQKESYLLSEAEWYWGKLSKRS